MKKLFLGFTLIVSFLISCSKETETKVDAKLSTNSEGILEFSSSAGEKTISVNTDQKVWKSYSNASWVQLSDSEKELKIYVEKNSLTKNRQAEISIFAGNACEKIMLIQSGNDISINFKTQKLNIDNWKGEYILEIDTNSDDWTATSNSNWVSVTPNQLKKELIINVQENTQLEERKTTLSINTNSGKLSELEIVQKGGYYFILPFLNPDADLSMIDAYEKERRSSLVYNEEFLSTPNNPDYATKSECFPLLMYFTYKGTISQCNMLAKNLNVLNEDCIQFLKNAGFKETANVDEFEKETIGTDGTKYQVLVTIIRETDSDSGIIFEFIPQQSTNYETFTVLPLGNTNFQTATRKSINTWELLKEAYPEAETESSIFFSFKDHAEGLIGRRYWIPENQTGFSQGAAYVNQITRAYYEAKGKMRFTKEFIAFLKEKGYEFKSQGTDKNKDFYFYINKDKTVIVAFACRAYNDLNNYNKVIDIRFIEGSASVASFSKTLDLMNAKNKKQYKSIRKNNISENYDSNQQIFFN